MGQEQTPVRETLTLKGMVEKEPAKKAVRRERIPVGRGRDILSIRNIDKDPNKEYYWVNVNTSEGMGRLDRFKAGGWEIVPRNLEVGDPAVDRGSQLGSAVTHTRGGQTLVLMCLPKEWWEEDQKAKQERVDTLELAMNEEMRQGRFPGTGSSDKGSYIPEGGGLHITRR